MVKEAGSVTDRKTGEPTPRKKRGRRADKRDDYADGVNRPQRDKKPDDSRPMMDDPPSFPHQTVNMLKGRV